MVEETEYPEETTDLPQVTDKLDHIMLFPVVSSGYSVSSTIKTDCHNITEILLEVALNTITLTLTLF
jgi:hypothetical protein